MMLPALLLLGMVLKLSQSFQDFGLILHDQNVTGVLGEDVYMRCLYTGNSSVEYSSWSRRDSSTNVRKLAGYKHDGKRFTKDLNFDAPASPSNLTVKVRIDSFKMEGLYSCTFGTEDEEDIGNVYLTVIARPNVKTHLDEDEVNGTLYQTVFCSASDAKPMALLHWEIHGAHPSKDVYSIHTNTTLSDDTASVFSSLRFPIHLNNESSVTCVIQHPALSKPNRTVITVQAFVAPHVSMEMATIHKEEKEFFEVKCKAKGGRPHPKIQFLLPGNGDTSQYQRTDLGSDAVSTYWFPSDLYEGKNVTCVFGYPHHPDMNSTSVTLPEYDLTSIQLTYNSTEIDKETAPDEPLILMEGDSGTIISMKAVGNVPSYKINCSKDDEPLPEEVHVTDSSLFIKGPVNLTVAGQYHCQASYNRHTTSLRFHIDVKPAIISPVGSPPNISVNLKKETDRIYLECLASDASPAANVSWVIPQDLERTIQSNITSSNGLHSVRSILMLPACLFQNQTVECVVEHILLTDHDRRVVELPVCAPISVTLQSNTTWAKNGLAYTEVKCSADNVTPNTTIRWDTEICEHEVTSEVKSQEEHGVLVNIAWLSALSYAGCTVICVVEHQGLKKPITKSLKFPLLGRPIINVSVGPQTDSPYWAATCEYEGAGLIPNISWVTSNLSTTVLPSHIHKSTTGNKVLLKLTHSFPLSQHEGKPLTCSIQNETRTINVPKYFISSITVLNCTRALSERHVKHVQCTVTLQKYVPDQRIVFKMNGNASASNFKCFRPSGLGAFTIDMTLVFVAPVLDIDAGLYTCNASWYHHKATVFLQVKVTNREEQSLTLLLVCFSSAAAIFIILIVALCIACRKSGERQPSAKSRRNRESLSALMQDPRSPELKKAAGKGQDYAELMHYSIVTDFKTTV